MVAFTHNFSQTERRWGREGAKELAGSANIRLILPCSTPRHSRKSRRYSAPSKSSCSRRRRRVDGEWALRGAEACTAAR
ncbi:hypothetical protein HYG77_38080 (plasmid) [Rhodococcus sp. ZPP]|nr:hypothetical protein HYG77_38080 [Rhodococcus sp. ZPP]